MRHISLLLLMSALSLKGLAQEPSDSTRLKEVVVRAYLSQQAILTLPTSVSKLSAASLKYYPPYSLVSALNSVAGLRMEERSPGSYRLSMRGSSLRSPFGIRNVKVYLDEFMLTDAGGNTYLNLLDAGSISEAEVLKGPEGSIYGANTGGVLLLESKQLSRDTTQKEISVSGGSFGLLHQKLSFHSRKDRLQLGVDQAYQRADGYRENSAMNRKFLRLIPRYNYSDRADVKAMLLYSNLSYETPGGLTLQQYQENPRMARQRAGQFPGAAEQRAAIYNESFMGGLAHRIQLNKRLRHVLSFTGMASDYKNPTINNYEIRKEQSVGVRTYFELSSLRTGFWKMHLGTELQQTSIDVDRYDNLSGQKGEEQTADKLKARQGFLFWQASLNLLSNLFLEGAVSLNAFGYDFQRFYPAPGNSGQRDFNKQVMPRIACSWQPWENFSLRASLSKGYSPPTLEEVNPSSEDINRTIEAEKGWNREVGFRLLLFGERLYWDAAFFHFGLTDAIVRNVDAQNRDYYLNAGTTRQLGLESEFSFILFSRPSSSFLNRLKISNAFTLSRFKFGSYVVNGTDYSGNKLPGVPQNTVVTSLYAGFPENISLFLSHNYTSSLPLNNANSIQAARFHLLNARVAWNVRAGAFHLEVFTGADNLLNEQYSLGNDINAFGSRYFNAAATRNFYGGLGFRF